MKFFTFLRNKSTTNKDYVKYALGEVFLVVIGILIALSVNNSNAIKIPAIIKTISITAYL